MSPAASAYPRPTKSKIGLPAPVRGFYTGTIGAYPAVFSVTRESVTVYWFEFRGDRVVQESNAWDIEDSRFHPRDCFGRPIPCAIRKSSRSLGEA